MSIGRYPFSGPSYDGILSPDETECGSALPPAVQY